MIKLFVCLECGNIFEESNQWQETHGLDSGPYECFSGCPHCGGIYTKAYQCDSCDEWIVDDYIKIGDNRYCQDCWVLIELGDEDE